METPGRAVTLSGAANAPPAALCGSANHGRETMIRTAPLLAAGFGLIATAALAGSEVLTGDSASGPVLTDVRGMTLYTFDKDTGGTSACYDGCAKNWPPLPATDAHAADGDFGIIERTDGTYQWTYKGMPLYTWIKDAKPGDTTGDGVNGVWHVARP
jgi:predicted lipoprotein with Yx(FWY)xxD motif